MTNIPAPLTPEDCDCTDLDGFMLNVERLMASELVALSSHEVVAAALFVWCRAWKQRPAASLPDDERVIAAFARLPIPKFRRLREEIMRGFVKCSDGRLYHRTLAVEAVKAFERKTAFQRKRADDRERLKTWRHRNSETNTETQAETSSETRDETRFVAEGQGQVSDRDREKESSNQIDADAPKNTPVTTLDLTEKPIKSSKKKPSTSIPEGFPSPGLQHWATDFWRERDRFDLSNSVADEVEKFRDYAMKGDVKHADWTAAWRYWCRNALKFNKDVSHGTTNRSKAGNGSVHQRHREGWNLLLDAESKRQSGEPGEPVEGGDSGGGEHKNAA